MRRVALMAMLFLLAVSCRPAGEVPGNLSDPTSPTVQSTTTAQPTDAAQHAEGVDPEGVDLEELEQTMAELDTHLDTITRALVELSATLSEGE